MKTDNKVIFHLFLTCVFVVGTLKCVYCQVNHKNPYFRITSHHGIIVDISQIDSSEFNSFENTTYIDEHYKAFDYEEQTETELSLKYPLIFKKQKGFYVFPLENDDTIRLNRIPKEEDLKGMMDYKFTGQFENFTVIYADGFEWWSYYLVDLNGKSNYVLPGEPIFNHFSNTVISWDNYYGGPRYRANPFAWFYKSTTIISFSKPFSPL